MSAKLKVIGLTGGIASGKSLVGDMFRALDIPVLDADSLGHMVLEPGQPAYEKVLSVFGNDILGIDNEKIDRQKLGKKVFDNTEERLKLEAITHPEIASLAAKGLSLIAGRGEKFAVYEAALLVETEIYKQLEALIVLSSSLENQLVRLCQRDKLSKDDAALRIANQLPLVEKLKVADYVIENNSTYEELKLKAVGVAELLKEKYN
ncbi:MAG: dephospho-CoA kinase [Deltaproteobacteria bacterium]|nr:dephospho-CoA kinase [Deltaproteobacteria bacterium]